MPIPPPATPGQPLGEVDTPALIVDLDAFERNLARMAARARDLGVRLRPHAKTHKSAAIALKQMALGAVGVCCQKVGEAEALVAGGVPDVLVTNEVIGARKLARVAALARQARIAVCVDAAEAVAPLAQAARAAGSRIGVLVEVDVGGRRCGTAPGEEAAALGALIASHPTLELQGIQAYHGSAQHFRTPAERQEAIAASGRLLAQTLAAFKARRLSCRTVGGAGTGTFEIEGASGLWNEIQPGSYIFMDADYARNLGPDGQPARAFEHALFLYCTVMSTPAPERAVVDAGHKALSNDSGFPEVVGLAGAAYHRPADEHGVLDLARCNSRPRLGDKIALIPGHCDPTVNLHDWLVGVRGYGGPDPRVETLWPVTARGAVT